MTVVYLGM